jgi:hypothetical protein
MSFTYYDPVLHAGCWSLIHAGANRPWSWTAGLENCRLRLEIVEQFS